MEDAKWSRDKEPVSWNMIPAGVLVAVQMVSELFGIDPMDLLERARALPQIATLIAVVGGVWRARSFAFSKASVDVMMAKVRERATTEGVYQERDERRAEQELDQQAWEDAMNEGENQANGLD